VEVDIDRWFRKYGNSIPFALPNHLQLPTRSDNHRETADVSTPPRQAPQVRKRIALNIRISHRIHHPRYRIPRHPEIHPGILYSRMKRKQDCDPKQGIVLHSISMRRPQPLYPSQLRLCNLPLRDGFVAVFRDILTRRSVGAEPAQAAEDAWAHCQIREDEVRY
jgi:hypothetical protein